jgi:hypothetical protein
MWRFPVLIALLVVRWRRLKHKRDLHVDRIKDFLIKGENTKKPELEKLEHKTFYFKNFS